LVGAANGQSLPVTETYHSVLLSALSPIPDVAPGDSVGWHCDIDWKGRPTADELNSSGRRQLGLEPW
jgi:hypothetical protein